MRYSSIVKRRENGNNRPSQAHTNALIKSIVDRIARIYSPKKIILFGSYANGNPRDGSDVDLLVVKNTREAPSNRWLRIRKIVRELTRLIPISPLILTEKELQERLEAGDFFLKEIIRDGKVLYASQ